jgi:hypothetical protein
MITISTTITTTATIATKKVAKKTALLSAATAAAGLLRGCSADTDPALALAGQNTAIKRPRPAPLS